MMQSSRSTFGLLAAATVALCAPASAAMPRVPPSQVAVAATTGDALVLWDATVMINTLATQHVANPQALRRIEATAGNLLVQKAKGLTPAAKTVTVKIMFASSPLVEVYRSATFEGFEQLALVTATRTDAVARAAPWAASLERSIIPGGMHITVTGQLPKS